MHLPRDCQLEDQDYQQCEGRTAHMYTRTRRVQSKTSHNDNDNNK